MVAPWAVAMILAVGLPACTAASLPMATSVPPPPDVNAAVTARARDLLAELAARRWDHPGTTFAPAMAAALPPDRLRALWESLETDAGAFARIEGIEAVHENGLGVANATCAFARLRRIVRVVFDADNRVAGLFVTPVPADIEAKVRFLIQRMAQGDFAGATRDFGAVMTAALPPSKLAQAWALVQEKAGPWHSVERIELVPRQGYWHALAHARFERGSWVIKVVYDGRDEILGLFFTPPEVGWTPPAYATPAAFEERSVEVGTAPALPGTLTLPRGGGPFPAVALVHGSGPNDRDESLGGVKMFRDLAWGLASRGIAVLRYEKRSRYAPAGVVTQKEEVVDGARAALELLRRTPEIDRRRIFLLGHSQGGTVAPRIAAEEPELAGVIILAGATRPLGQLLVDQLTYLSTRATDSPSLAAELQAARQFQRAAEDPSLRPEQQVPLPGGGRISGAYLLDDRAHDPRAEVARLSCRLLIAQGLRDYQVTMTDFDGWRTALAGSARATFKTYPALNHLFVAGNGPSTPAEYDHPGHVDETVIDDVARWIGGAPGFR